MKKKIFATAALAMAACSMFSAGCSGVGQEVVTSIDKNKTQIYLSLVIGGTGSKWLDDLVLEYNKTQTKYEFVVAYEKLNTAGVRNNINSGVTGDTVPSVYYTNQVDLQELIYSDKLEDISDILTREVDGAGNGTLQDKIGADSDYYETVWHPLASKNGEGLYMLPYADSFGGLIFDYGTYVENGFLNLAANDAATKSALTAQGVSFTESNGALVCSGYTGTDIYFNYKEGDTIMTAGKDGKFGSYDDGQPQTIAEWEAMLAKMTAKGYKPFIWSGAAYGYVDMITGGVMAQYAGLDEYNTYHTYEGSVRINGQETTITPDTGYLVYGMDGFAKAVNFVNDYINNETYYHPKSKESISHTDAQGLYILAHRQNKNQPMMIVDGEWWENEAKPVFAGKKLIEEGRGYGTRDYRFMLIPNLEGQKGVDGNGHGSMMYALNSGAIIVPKCPDKDKLAAIKDFLCYTLTEEALRAFTVETSIANAYDYDLTAEDLSKMTPFARTVFQMYHDNDNIGIARGMALYHSNPMRYATGGGFFRQVHVYAGESTTGKIEKDGLVALLDVEGVTAANVIECTKNYYKNATNPNGQSQFTWESLLANAREAGFFKN